MLEISIIDLIGIVMIAFTLGMIWEYIASYFDYKTGEWVGRRYSNSRDRKDE